MNTPFWVNDVDVQDLLNAIAPARVVGGAVRNHILGLNTTSEVDIATPHTPEVVTQKALQSGYKVFPTGLQHGTVTCVRNKKVYEVTTLRIDTQTDGRHANVEFCQSWEEDAKRRDLTINALYSDAQGNVYDYVNGIQDLRSGTIRFIGNPARRIQEDYLRIFRFFRFFSHYGKTLDQPSLQACIDHSYGIERIAKERCIAELFRLLETPNPVPALSYMDKCNLWRYAKLPAANLAKLQDLLQAAAKSDISVSVPCKFATFEGSYTHLPLSNVVKTQLNTLHKSNPLLKLADYIWALNTMQIDLFWDLVALKGQNNSEIVNPLNPWIAHPFPLKGKDLVAHPDIQPGPVVGQLLKRLLSYYCNQPTPTHKQTLLQVARQITMKGDTQ